MHTVTKAEFFTLFADHKEDFMEALKGELDDIIREIHPEVEFSDNTQNYALYVDIKGISVSVNLAFRWDYQRSMIFGEITNAMLFDCKEQAELMLKCESLLVEACQEDI